MIALIDMMKAPDSFNALSQQDTQRAGINGDFLVIEIRILKEPTVSPPFGRE